MSRTFEQTCTLFPQICVNMFLQYGSKSVNQKKIIFVANVNENDNERFLRIGSISTDSFTFGNMARQLQRHFFPNQ